MTNDDERTNERTNERRNVHTTIKYINKSQLRLLPTFSIQAVCLVRFLPHKSGQIRTASPSHGLPSLQWPFHLDGAVVRCYSPAVRERTCAFTKMHSHTDWHAGRNRGQASLVTDIPLKWNPRAEKGTNSFRLNVPVRSPKCTRTLIGMQGETVDKRHL